MKKILIASTVALFVGGWWFGAGGTYGSPEEAREKAFAWQAKGKTWKYYKKEANPELDKFAEKQLEYDRQNMMSGATGSLLRHFINQGYTGKPPYKAEYDTSRCPPTKDYYLYDCYVFLSGIPKTIDVEVIESTRKCKSSGMWGKDFQMTCQERPYKTKGWKGAKYVYFKVK